MTPLDSLRALKASLGSTAKLAALVPGKRYGTRQLRRWIAGTVPIPPHVADWLASQDYVPVGENLHDKSDSSDSGQKTD